ncbi:hypothetical protein GQR58_006003 [Nymphon striatum]|nr:hypothetical protein GQR58_006003 [Nymphon striatum]
MGKSDSESSVSGKQTLSNTLKLSRRGAKGALTRVSNAIQYNLNNNRPKEEIMKMLSKLETAYESLVTKHEQYSECIEDEKDYELLEEDLNNVQVQYLEVWTRTKDYVSTIDKQVNHNTEPQEFSNLSISDSDNNKNLSSAEENIASTKPTDSVCKFKLERPKMPTFSGDVREYGMFKSDFKHAIEAVYSKRDAISLLRTCLSGKPLEYIKGIGTDYDAAWEYLDAMYGDPRIVSDVVTQNIMKYRNLKEGEDSRFCDLAHLVRRSFNILKEMGLPNDMNNNHMLAIIEQKLCMEDRKIWSRCLEGNGGQASLEKLLEWLTVEMKTRMRAGASIRSSNQGSRISVAQVWSGVANPKCWICKSFSHWVDQCQTLLDMDVNERIQFIKSNYACFSCLKKCGRNHNMKSCNRKQICSEEMNGEKCKQFHHRLLHSNRISNNNVNINTIQKKDDQALLPMITAEIFGLKRKKTANVLLDSGAQISLIKESLAKELRLKGENVITKLVKVGGHEEEILTKIYNLRMKPMNKENVYEVWVLAIPEISKDVSEVNLQVLAEKFRIDTREIYRKAGSIDILIGIDHAFMHEGITRNRGGLIARLSPLGWVIFGAEALTHHFESKIYHLQGISRPVDLTDFWTTESMGISCQKCECELTDIGSERLQEAKMISDSCRKIGQQWQIAYPWCKDLTLLTNNVAYAERRLKSTEQRVLRNPKLATSYAEQMNELVDLGFARKLSKEEIKSYKGPVQYIAHREVINPDKISTPLRIVFNCIKLNEYMYKGPDLLNNLWGVLLRFRENKVAINADISKMYHRILIPERDQHLHRYLWRNLDIHCEVEHCVKTVLTFGDKAAPAMALTALQKTAEENKTRFPRASQTLAANTYMDDICDSVDTIKEAGQIVKDIESVLESGGFKVKKWYSNRRLDVDNQVKNLDSTNDNFPRSTSYESVLGLFTKRKILSKISGLFDPIGFAAAFIVRAKIGMQDLWSKSLEWDEQLDANLENEWKKFFDEMRGLEYLKFDRCLTPDKSVGQPVLCIFADGSEKAFGTCAYMRWEINNGEFGVRFVGAKSRVAPLKKISIPRLELQAAVLASRIYKTIKAEK